MGFDLFEISSQRLDFSSNGSISRLKFCIARFGTAYFLSDLALCEEANVAKPKPVLESEQQGHSEQIAAGPPELTRAGGFLLTGFFAEGCCVVLQHLWMHH